MTKSRFIKSTLDPDATILDTTQTAIEELYGRYKVKYNDEWTAVVESIKKDQRLDKDIYGSIGDKNSVARFSASFPPRLLEYLNYITPGKDFVNSQYYEWFIKKHRELMRPKKW